MGGLRSQIVRTLYIFRFLFFSYIYKFDSGIL